MTLVDLTKLWTHVTEGDHLAWQQLVERYASLVYTVACRAGLSSLDAEDCAQHTWLALYRNRRSIKDPSSVPAWLIRTTHREAVRMARDLSRLVATGDEDNSRDRGALPDELVHSLELQVALKEAMSRLEPRCRTLIAEMYLSNGDKKYRDVAGQMGIKPNSFGPLRKRCLIKLRDILKKMGYSMD